MPLCVCRPGCGCGITVAMSDSAMGVSDDRMHNSSEEGWKDDLSQLRMGCYCSCMGACRLNDGMAKGGVFSEMIGCDGGESARVRVTDDDYCSLRYGNPTHMIFILSYTLSLMVGSAPDPVLTCGVPAVGGVGDPIRFVLLVVDCGLPVAVRAFMREDGRVGEEAGAEERR